MRYLGGAGKIKPLFETSKKESSKPATRPSATRPSVAAPVSVTARPKEETKMQEYLLRCQSTMKEQSVELEKSKETQKQLVKALAKQLAMTPDDTKIEMERLRRKNRILEEHERTLKDIMKVLRTKSTPNLLLPRMSS